MSGKTTAMAVIGGAALAVLATSSAFAATAEPGRMRDMTAAAAGVNLLPVAAQAGLDGATGSPLSLAPAPRRTLQLDSKGRWGFRLDMEQPTARDQDFRDVQAGAYYRIGKGLRVGGTVGFGPSPSPQNIRPQDDAAPRVRLESNFKF